MTGDESGDASIAEWVGELARVGNVRPYPRKSLLIREGELGTSLFVLLEGRIRIFSEDLDGHRFVFGAFGPGTIFGEVSLDRGPRTASVEALTDCVCADVPYTELYQRMANDQGFAMTLLAELIRRSRASTMRIKSLALDTVYQRLRTLIETESIEQDGMRYLGPELSQQEIANRLGASRDMITKIFRDLTKGEYVETGRGGTRILRPLPKEW
jgi:CRP/FNR family cyclic AMP-dependent transcriptional regulator